MKTMWVRLKILGALRSNVITLFASGTAAQGLIMLAYPALTRIYSPAQMGELAAVTTAVMIFLPLFSLRYETALLIAKDDEEAGNLLALCLSIMTGMGAALACALPFLPGWAGGYELFMPLGLVGMCSYTLVITEAIRVGRFSDIARTRLYQAVTGPLAQIGLGGLGWGTLGLMTGFVIGAGSGTLGLGWRLLHGPRSPLRLVSLAGMRAAASNHRHFALFSSWATVMHNAATDLMPLGCTVLFGPQIGGVIYLGDRILGRPLQVLGMAFQQVYDGDASKALQTAPHALRGIFLRVVVRQAVAGALWMTAMFAFADLVVPAVFGQQWSAAGPFVRALVIGHFATLVADPVHNTIMLLQRQQLSALMSLLLFIMVAGTLGGSWAMGASPLDAVLACSLARAGGNALFLAATYVILCRLQPPPAGET